MTLMKLRLNLNDADNGYRFGVHHSTVSRLILKWINIMYIRLKSIVLWPQQGDLKISMAREFAKQLQKHACIIDCFEMFCERPSGVMSRAMEIFKSPC